MTPGPPDTTGELAGLTVVADASLRIQDEGRVLVGGSPLRVVRLKDGGARLVRRLVDGEPLPAGRAATTLARRLLDGGLVHPTWADGPLGPHDVTVVVPVLGSLAASAVERLQRSAGAGHQIRVLVVDDASPAPIADLPGADVVRRATNGGPAAARNTGLGHVDTALVAFVDADCEPPEGWLEGLLPHFADPLVAAVAPRIVAPATMAGPIGAGALTGRAAPSPAAVSGPGSAHGGSPPPATEQPLGAVARRSRLLARYESVRAPLDLGPEPARVRARTRVSYVPSAALVVRAEVLRELGGFDEAMTVGEDVDLVWRLDEAGWSVRYEPAVAVAHRHRTSPGAWLRRRFDYGTSAGPLAIRHPGALVPLEASGWSLATWGLAAAGHPVLGSAVAATTVPLLARRLSDVPGGTAIAARLTGLGHLGAGRLIADALVRPWWPVSGAAALASRRARRVVAVAAVAPLLAEWVQRRPPIDPVRWTALRLADQAAYGAGVWVGSWRSRTAEPLVPDLTSWPRPSRYTRWRQALGVRPGSPTDAGR